MSESPRGAAAPARREVILLLGPTASGKTDVSLVLADALHAEIVAADSRQVYRGLDVGTGKPDEAARARVAHHVLDVLEPGAVANAAAYARSARAALEAVERAGRTALVVGGSGLYVRALVGGLFAGPGRDEVFRAALAARAARDGWPALHAELAARDADAAARIHPNDAVRITRSLEIAAATGLTATAARRRLPEGPLDRPVRAFGLAWPRAALDARITRRFSAMLAAGLVAEVEALLARGVAPDAPALRSPGYAQVVRHLAGEISLDEAEALAVRATRQYAKRQMTWFRKVPDVVWIDGHEDPARPAQAILDRLRLPA